MENCRTLPEQVLKNTQDIANLLASGTITVGDLLTLLIGSDTIIVDLAASGEQVEIHLDEHFKQTLATKTDLTGKLNIDTIYSNDNPAFKDAMELVSSLTDFYSYFYNLRKEPSKIYLIQGQPTIEFDNLIIALNMPDVKGQKWAMLVECLSTEAGGFFIKLSLTNANHTILFTNTIGGWLSGAKIGAWQDATTTGGGLTPVTERSIVYGTDGNGKQTTIQYNKDAVGGGLAQRNDDGTVSVANPVSNKDAVNKETLTKELKAVNMEFSGTEDSSATDLKVIKVTKEDGAVDKWKIPSGGGSTKLFIHRIRVGLDYGEIISTTDLPINLNDDKNTLIQSKCFIHGYNTEYNGIVPIGFLMRGGNNNWLIYAKEKNSVTDINLYLAGSITSDEVRPYEL